MRYPHKIKPGDTVGLICPSSPVSRQRVDQCVKVIERLGYKVKPADNLVENYGGYMAGTGEKRGQWVNEMFADPEVKAIFCIRGGDGSSRIMEYLNYDLIKNHPKMLVGFSDVTNLHLGITQNCDLITFHGPMVSSNLVDDFDEETRRSFYQAIEADAEYTFQNPKGFPLEVLQKGEGEGRLIGGNLSLLSASIGTPYEVNTEDKILFIEEVSEPLTKIEKWTYHLRNAGKLRQCKGILLGQFTGVANEDNPKYDVISCMEDILKGLEIPVMYNVQSGHGRPMMTLPMGALCTMDTEKKEIRFIPER